MPQSYERKFLRSLSKDYPTVAAATEEIINLQAILKLPKPTEHFMSDLHGEADAFTHILSNASGVIREKANRVLGTSVPEQERAEFATLIYYPAQKLAQLKPRQTDLAAFYRTTLYRLIDTCRVTASKYTRSFVRKRLPKTYAYILDELLHAHFEDHDKDLYYGSILTTIINTGEANHFIIALCELIRNLAVHRLHIVGDVFDRGARPDVIMDELLSHHAADVQWGNHDVQWMGAAAGSDICIAGVIRVALAYNNLETLEDGYGINLRPLALFASRGIPEYGHHVFLSEDHGRRRLFPGRHGARRAYAQGREHPSVQAGMRRHVHRNPEFGMARRAPCWQHVDFANPHRCRSTARRWPHARLPISPRWTRSAPARPSRAEEEDVLARNCGRSFAEERQRLAAPRRASSTRKGGMYRIENGNLLYPRRRADGARTARFAAGAPGQRRAVQRAAPGWTTARRMARPQGYFAPARQRRSAGKGRISSATSGAGRSRPCLGAPKWPASSSISSASPRPAPSTKTPIIPWWKTRTPPWPKRRCAACLPSLSWIAATGHIINGHVPVLAKNGESPVKAGGKLIVIDGGFCKAYHTRTGIAGYTLVFFVSRAQPAQPRPV